MPSIVHHILSLWWNALFVFCSHYCQGLRCLHKIMRDSTQQFLHSQCVYTCQPWMASYYSHTQKIVILRTWNTKDPAAQTAQKWRRVSRIISLLLMSQSSPRNDQINCWIKASASLVVNLILPFNFCWCETVERWGQRRTCLKGYRFSRILGCCCHSRVLFVSLRTVGSLILSNIFAYN